MTCQPPRLLVSWVVEFGIQLRNTDAECLLKLAAERYISKHEMSWFQFATICLQHIVFQYHRLLITSQLGSPRGWEEELEAREKEEEEENKDILEESNKETSDGDDQR